MRKLVFVILVVVILLCATLPIAAQGPVRGQRLTPAQQRLLRVARYGQWIGASLTQDRNSILGGIRGGYYATLSTAERAVIYGFGN